MREGEVRILIFDDSRRSWDQLQREHREQSEELQRLQDMILRHPVPPERSQTQVQLLDMEQRETAARATLQRSLGGRLVALRTVVLQDPGMLEFFLE